MSSDLAFTTSKRKKKPITFTVDETEYEFTPPKDTETFLDMMGVDDLEDMDKAGARGIWRWFVRGLGEKQAETILSRLKDDDDDLTVEDVMQYARKLAEKINGGRPTT